MRTFQGWLVQGHDPIDDKIVTELYDETTRNAAMAAFAEQYPRVLIESAEAQCMR